MPNIGLRWSAHVSGSSAYGRRRLRAFEAVPTGWVLKSVEPLRQIPLCTQKRLCLGRFWFRQKTELARGAKTKAFDA